MIVNFLNILRSLDRGKIICSPHPFSRSYTAISVTISRIECMVCPVFSITNENEPPPKFIGYPSLTSTSFLRPISSSHLAQLFPHADALNFEIPDCSAISGVR